MESISPPGRFLEVIPTGIALDSSNPTAQTLSQTISQQGPIPYREFMRECLFGQNGYYSEGKVTIGKRSEKMILQQVLDK